MLRLRSRWGLLCAALGALTLTLGWAVLIEPGRLIVRREELALPHFSVGSPAVRVALLSDLHVGSPHWSLTRLQALVTATNAEQPDLVLLAGDYLINGVWGGSWVAPEPIAEVLGGLRAPLGVAAVLGNHDWWNDGPRVRRALEAHGIRVLENRALPIAAQGGTFFVVGLADATRKQDLEGSLAQVPDGAPCIVLVHEPDIFPGIDERVALTLAGHTHGGQVRLPFIGRPVVPSRYGQRYAAGHIVEGGRHLFVTSGVGTSIYPVRLGVPPEIALLTLRAAG